MAEIVIAGATYNDVPAIEVPKVGGGVARFDERIKNYKFSSGEIEKGTQISVSVECNVGDLIIAQLWARSLETLPSDWTFIATSDIVASNDIRLTWMYKFATSDREMINYAQANTNRMYVNLIAINGASGFANMGFQCHTTAAASHTLTKDAGICILGVAVQQYKGSEPYPVWECPTADDIIQIGGTAPSRLAAFLFSDDSTSVTLAVPNATSTKLYAGILKIHDLTEWRK